MRFEDYLSEIIRDEADKHILRFHAYHNGLEVEHARQRRRVKNPPTKIVHVPDHWKADDKHNPFYVRRRRKAIARSITKKIASKAYKPRDPFVREIPKSSGGNRRISIYQIPDAAVSRLYYERLLAKNRHRLSHCSYAYRSDSNVHFAIQDIALDISRDARSFVAEFDFSDFFGSVSHDYLRAQYDSNGFFISDEERHVIDAFLGEAGRGIPQGTSISLFLANMVCWRLDLNLERAGLKFARYADDTVIWSPSYERICESFSIINEFSSAAGIAINAEKSDGISLLVRGDLPSELPRPKTEIEFLGYAISVESISIKASAIRRIKKQISYLLYRNLIQPLKGPRLQAITIPSNGKDQALLPAMMQIRRYLYGRLTSQQLSNYLAGRRSRIQFKGIMSFYPLVTDQDQLRALDGWLIATIYRSLKRRNRMLAAWGYNRSSMFPFNVSQEEMAREFRRVSVRGKRLLEVPSFTLINRALQKGLADRGILNVMNPQSSQYIY